jgi:hypothetical protein
MTSTSIIYGYSTAESCVQRFDNTFPHIWAGPRPRVHFRFTKSVD